MTSLPHAVTERQIPDLFADPTAALARRVDRGPEHVSLILERVLTAILLRRLRTEAAESAAGTGTRTGTGGAA